MTLQLGRHSFADDATLMMAIVNRTPDSFYDRGSPWVEEEAFDRVATVGGPPFPPGPVQSGRQDLGGHPAEVAQRLVPMSPAAEVDLSDRVDATRAQRVDQGGGLHGVPGGDVQ